VVVDAAVVVGTGFSTTVVQLLRVAAMKIADAAMIGVFMIG